MQRSDYPAYHSPLTAFTCATSIIREWRACSILAIEAERQLLDLGWYNIDFKRMTGAWNGVVYPLEEEK